ncbi:adenylate/guanylate cyclase domain-containing protein [Chloroflexota bacterium]
MKLTSRIVAMSTDFYDSKVPPKIPDMSDWSTVVSYLPNILLDTIYRYPDRSPPWIDSLEGSLLLADISGFTSISERLAEVGKEGAEWLTSIINQYFHSMLDIARKYDGTKIKFGGDALLLLFKSENHAHRAVAAALAMQQATRKLTTFHVGKYHIRLSMTVGVHSGVFWSTVAGLPNSRMQHFILGQEASRVDDVQATAVAGELLITKETLDMLGELCLTESHDNFYRVIRLSKRIPSPPIIEQEVIFPISLVNKLLAYLPPPIAQVLQSGGQAKGIEGEHRKVSIAFINLIGVNELLVEHGPEILLNELQQCLSSVVRLADQYDCFLMGNDIYTHGLKLILIFGAPVAHEQDSANALRLGLELNRELARLNLNLHCRIGINSGFVFAGDVGPLYSRQYTVMGDAVNLSARLMSSASPNQVLISRQTAVEAGPSFVVQELSPISVKGKKEPIPICLLETEHAITPTNLTEQQGTLFGREAEVNSFRSLCQEVKNGNGRTVVISGEAGIGKSRLLLEFKDHLSTHGWEIYHGVCHSHTIAKPFAPWIHILNLFFGISPTDNIDTRTEKVLSLIKQLRPDYLETASLLNPLLGLAIPQGDVIRSLDDESRRQRLFEIITDVLLATATDSPLAVLLEDLHWADNSSLQLANQISASLHSSRFLMCLTHRPKKEMLLKPQKTSTVTIALGELPKDAALQMLQTILDHSELPDQFVEAVLLKSRGNPLFLEEVARSLNHSAALEQILSTPSFRLVEELASLNIPDRIQALIMSRVDTLSNVDKEALRTAAIIGSTFDFATLQALLSISPRDIPLESRLQRLVQLNIISQEEDMQELSYRFNQSLVQEVTYGSLLFARRRQLHHQVASYLEEVHREQIEPLYEVLVYHYRRSTDSYKTRFYSQKAAEKVRQIFAHEEAIEYYRCGLNSLQGKDNLLAKERSYFMEGIGDCYEASGQHAEAAHTFSQALRQWIKASRQSDISNIPFIDFDDSKPPKIRRSVLQHKIAVSYERNSEYDIALKHIESALHNLPSRQPLQLAKTVVTKCLALFRKGLYEEAIYWGHLGLSLSRRTGDKYNLAYAHNILASSYLDKGSIRKAIKYRQSAIRLYEELGDVSGQAEANNNLGACYQSLGDQDKALHHFQLSLTLCERIGNYSNTAIAHNNVGEVFLTLGKLDESIDHLNKVVETYDTKGDPLAPCGLALVNLSRAYQHKGDYGSASDYLEKGIRLLRKARARALLVEALLQQAELLLSTSQIIPAVNTCQRVLKITDELGMKLQQARGLHILGRIDTARGIYEQAEVNLQQSADLAKRIDANYDRGVALLSLAKLYIKLKQNKDSYRRCRVVLKQASAIFKQMGAQEDLSQILQLQNELKL